MTDDELYNYSQQLKDLERYNKILRARIDEIREKMKSISKARRYKSGQ